MRIPDDIRPDERILILGIPVPDAVAAMARILSDGALVVMAEGDALYEARRAAREFDNVMFVPGSPDDLAWRDGFFTRVVDIVGNWENPGKVQREIQRVTLPVAPRSVNG